MATKEGCDGDRRQMMTIDGETMRVIAALAKHEGSTRVQAVRSACRKAAREIYGSVEAALKIGGRK
jgi:hypothetical protein